MLFTIFIFLFLVAMPTQAVHTSGVFIIYWAEISFIYNLQEGPILLNKRDGLYGLDSPRISASGPIVLPYTDEYGCENASYADVDNYTTWIALIARGKCSFFTKIKQILVLRDIGGRNIDEFERRAMPFMITNSLAMRYNMSGRNGKMCFKDTIFWELICGAAKRNPCTKECNRKMVEVSVGKWFVGARDRDGNRSIRALREKRKRDEL